MKNITIEDIAKKAGVSIKTVSRVFNHEPNVRDRTKDKVLKAAQEMNYRPNMAARSLASNKSYVIVHFYDNPSPDYLERAHQGIHKACRANGYFAVMEPLRDKLSGSVNYSDEIQAYISEYSIDGIVLTPPLCDDIALIQTLDAGTIPYVRISPHYSPQSTSSTYIDERAAARLITTHLVELGHNNIAFISGPPNHGAAQERQCGFLDIVNDANLDLNMCPVLQGDFSFRSGFSAFEKLMDNKDKPSAIFAANDEMAAGVMVAALKAGLDIPSDISIAGYDGSRISQMLWPSITTIRQPVRALSKRATELLLKQIRDPQQKTVNDQLDITFINRDSTAPLK